MMKLVIGRLSVFLTVFLILCSSGAAQNLVVNGDFETASNFVGGPGNPNADKKFLAIALPLAWQNAPGSGSNYTYLCSPRTADGAANGGNPFPVYGLFPFSSAGGTTPIISDAGGNFLQQDGGPGFNSPVTQTINVPNAGLYVVSGKQAAGQQNHPNYTSPTTELWQITIGSSSWQTPQFSLPGPLTSGGTAADVGQWQTVSHVFNLPAGPQLLSLVAMGTPGGQPPIAFLDDLSVIAVPEPTSLAIIGIGLFGSVALRKFRRA
jgi:PEP-CTERM motif